MASNSFLYGHALRAIHDLAAAYRSTGDEFVRISVKRRTWRTLWLVPRTFRVKVPIISVKLAAEVYDPSSNTYTVGVEAAVPPEPDPRLVKRLTSDGSPIPPEPDPRLISVVTRDRGSHRPEPGEDYPGAE
jgi:hypothetical protein